MSTITNKFGLPEPLVRAVEWSDRDREGCDYTITECDKPARILALEHIHAHEITEDASERLWALLGSAGHEVLRRSAKTGVVEERAIVEVECDGKVFKVGGKLDYGVSDTTLFDYKFTSIYAAKEGPRSEWVCQLNAYRWLASHYGVKFDKLQIVAIFRDWSKSKASREQDYPQSQVKVLDLPMWTDTNVEAHIRQRIREHESAKTTLPLCSADDTWEKPAVWAVYRNEGSKRALRLYNSKESAEQMLNHYPYGKFEHRPAERPRCENYCRVAQFCSQWAEFKKS